MELHTLDVRSIHRGLRAIAAVLGCLACGLPAHGQATVTWDGSADMTWTQPDSTSWSGATYESGDTAVFAGAGTGTVTISGTVTPGQINVTAGSYTLSGAIGGAASVTQSGAGVLTLAGSGANTYAGTTTVSAGTLNLNKTTGVTAVAGDLSIVNAAVTFGTSNQIADTAAVTMSGANSVFNGTSYNNAVAGNSALDETVGSLAVTGGLFFPGGATATTGLAVTGAASFTGGAGNTQFIQNSGGVASFGSLSLIGLTSTVGPSSVSNDPNRFALFGNGTDRQSTVTVGSGGLSLDGSNLLLMLGTVSGRLGSRLVLNGDVTTTGSAASAIRPPTSNDGTFGTRSVELSSTAAAVTRTFTIGGGGADLSVLVPITNGGSAAASLAKAGPGTLLLTAANTYSGNTTISAGTLQIGNGGTTGSITGDVTNAGTIAFNRSNQVVFSGTISGSGSLVKDGSGELVLVANNTFTGPTVVNTGTLAIGNSGATGMIAGDIMNDATLVFRRSSAATYSGAISGSGAIVQDGANTLELAGATGNTFTGMTSVLAGRLDLNKSSGNAIGGDLTISGASSVTQQKSNQIFDTAVVQVTRGNFNGTAPNVGTLSSMSETIGQLHVSGSSSSFTTGNASNWTVTGAMSFTGGGGATFVGNGNATLSVGSLALTDMTGVAGGTIGVANSFTLYGSGTTTPTTLTVGSGGLALENSRLNLRRGTTGARGSRLVLDGAVTVTGTAASLIAEDTAGGTVGIRNVELSSTAGSHVRTFTVADVTSSVAPDLTVSVPITNGAATAGGLTKAGLGTLLLSASNTYTGPTNVLAGTLALGQAAAVAGSSGLSIAAGATLDLSALGSGLSLGSGQSLGGSGSILGSIAFGSGSSLIFSTTDTLGLAGGTASFFAGTPGSRFGIDDLIGISSSTPLGTYTLITGTVDFTNLDNVGAGSAYPLGDGVSAFFQQGSLQVVVVPEPAGIAGWVLGLVMAGALACRRRQLAPGDAAWRRLGTAADSADAQVAQGFLADPNDG